MSRSQVHRSCQGVTQSALNVWVKLRRAQCALPHFSLLAGRVSTSVLPTLSPRTELVSHVRPTARLVHRLSRLLVCLARPRDLYCGAEDVSNFVREINTWTQHLRAARPATLLANLVSVARV